MRIGLFGGSFDPIHKGHLSIIKGAIDNGDVDIVIVIPTVRNSFKRGKILNAAPYRYYMTKAVLDATFNPKQVFLCDVEFYISGISYTVSTLKRVTDMSYLVPFLTYRGVKPKKALEEHKFFWLCGSDLLPTFDHWYKPEEILQMAGLLVAVRPGDDTDIYEQRARLSQEFGFEANIESFVIDGVEAASSSIRERQAFDEVPAEAREFIKTHALYGTDDVMDAVSDEAAEKFFQYAADLYDYLGEKRLLHTINVGLLSARYAKIHGADVDKALIAGLLHDCAKELDLMEQRDLARRRSGDVFNDKKLFHSPAGASFAAEKFGIDDEEILNAITYHTTGRGGATMLDKIVYLADKLEPARTYTDLTEMREVALVDLDEAVRMCARTVAEKFKRQGREMHPMTAEFVRDLGM